MLSTKVHSWFGVAALVLGLLLALSGQAHAQIMQGKLLPFDGDPNDQFGWGVAHVPGWAFLGANLDDDVQDQSGAVYVYQSVGSAWAFTQKIKVPVPGFSDQFGNAVAASGDWMVASSWKADPGGVLSAGSAQVYQHLNGTWVHHQELVASDFDSGLTKNFGESVAMDGPVMLVGMPRDSFKHVESGSAYVFELLGSVWVETAKLAPSDPEDWEFGCFFGGTLDVSGDTLVIGAPFLDTDIPDSDRGAVFVFERSGSSWVQTQRLVSSDLEVGDSFGVSVAISEDTIMVGASSHEHPGPPNQMGAVYVFENTGGTWTETQELTVSDPWNPFAFGTQADLEGNIAIFGVGNDGDLGSLSGSAYAFRRADSGWEQFGKLLDPDGDPGDIFGSRARIAGTSILCAALGDDDACGGDPICNTGAAFIFELAPDTRQYSSCSVSGPCGNHDDHGGCANSTTIPGTGFYGQGAVLAAAGTTSVSADTLKLQTHWLPPNQIGVLFMGGGQNWLPFGDGRLVVGSGGSGVFRVLPPKFSGAAGVMTWDGGLVATSHAMGGAAMIDPGETWYFQTWYRDPLGPCGSGFNTSNGLQIDFTP